MKKVHRFIGPYDLRLPEIVLDDAAGRQISDVLKMRIGEHVLLCDGKDKQSEYEIVEVMKRSVRLQKFSADVSTGCEPARSVTLYAAILKRESFEWAVQKAVECGVTRIVPMITRRTIKKDVKQERLQEIAKEAAEQSGRGIVPVVAEPMLFSDALIDAKQNEGNYFLDIVGARFIAPDKYAPDKSGRDKSRPYGMFIGPEGGWDEEEIAHAKKTGLIPVSLGSRVLRGETAVAVAVYLMTI
ncbi:MAG: RsmE family RNA methyltransferase [Candidatus Uhrbacteria bacterium]